VPPPDAIQSRRGFLRNTILVYLKDRNKTVVYLNFTYTHKIDKIYAQMSSDRIPQEYSSGCDWGRFRHGPPAPVFTVSGIPAKSVAFRVECVVCVVWG